MAQSNWLQPAAFATVPLVLVLGNSMLVPILPDMAEHMGLTSLQSSLVISLFSLSAALFIPFIGYCADQTRRKVIIVPALAIYGAAGLLAGFAAVWHSYPLLISSRVIQGIAAAGTAPIAMALVGDLYKDGAESELLGLIEASNGAGKVISPILGSLLGLWIWYAPFFAFPIVCGGALLAVILFIQEPEHRQSAMPLKQYLSGMRDIYSKNSKWLFTAYFAGSLGLFILFGLLVYLSDMLEKPPMSLQGVAKGGVLAIPLLGLVITAYITGKVIKKSGKRIRSILIAGLMMMSASLIAASLWHASMIVLMIFISVSSIGTGFILPCLNTLITGAVDRSHRGMVTSLYNSLRFFGVAAGPPLFTWLAARSATWLFVMLTALSLASLWSVIALLHPPKQQSKA